MSDLSHILAAYTRYIEARKIFLEELHLNRVSNRDPLVEFSEYLVAALVQGTLAESRVQKHWDVQGPEGEKIQVKYLANSSSKQWVNEHPIQVNEGMDSYAIVILEALSPQAVIIFPARTLESVGMALNKRHRDLTVTLQFTRKNYLKILENPKHFRTLDVRLYLPPDWAVQ